MMKLVRKTISTNVTKYPKLKQNRYVQYANFVTEYWRAKGSKNFDCRVDATVEPKILHFTWNGNNWDQQQLQEHKVDYWLEHKKPYSGRN